MAWFDSNDMGAMPPVWWQARQRVSMILAASGETASSKRGRNMRTRYHLKGLGLEKDSSNCNEAVIDSAEIHYWAG